MVFFYIAAISVQNSKKIQIINNLMVFCEWSGAYHGRSESTKFDYNGHLDISVGAEDAHFLDTVVRVRNFTSMHIYFNI